MIKSKDSESDSLDLNPRLVTPLCVLGQVTSLLCASVSPTGKEIINNTYLTGPLQGFSKITDLQHLRVPMHSKSYYVSVFIIIIILITIKSFEAGIIANSRRLLCAYCI